MRRSAGEALLAHVLQTTAAIVCFFGAVAAYDACVVKGGSAMPMLNGRALMSLPQS